MRRRKIVAIFLMLFFLISLAYATILVEVDVKEVIDGNIAYLKFQKKLNNSPQHILLDWENQGSVGCKVRFRVDFYHPELNLPPEDEPVYTAWSKEKALEPGDHSPFEIFFYPKKSGNYSAKLFVYYCNLLLEERVINFTALMKEEGSMNESVIENMTENVTLEREVEKRKKRIQTKEKEVPFEITEVETTENYVEFKIKSKENISNLIIIPTEYPIGWIFESGKIEKIEEGGEKALKVGYSPSIWKEKKISFDLVTLDGKYHTIAYVTLKKEEKKEKFSFEQKIIGILSLIIRLFSHFWGEIFPKIDR
jgi:regulator of replication initiation timing